MIIKLTRNEALKFDLLVCKCGHRVNNHFEFRTKPCAHCKCKEYSEKPRVGKIIKTRRKKKDYSWFGGEVDRELIRAIVDSEKKK